MKPVDQDRFHAEGDEFAGNCFAACIASLLEVDLHDIPMPRRDDEGWNAYWTALAVWLRDHGWMLVDAGADSESPRPWTTEDVLDEKEGLAILSGPGPRGHRHSVIGTLAGEILHDPHPSRDGLRSWDTVSWLVPLDPSRYPTTTASAERKASEKAERQRDELAEALRKVSRYSRAVEISDIADAALAKLDEGEEGT